VPDTLQNDIPKSVIELNKCKITMCITGFLDCALQLDDHYIEDKLKAGAFQNVSNNQSPHLFKAGDLIA
jgi:hypothetical protein